MAEWVCIGKRRAQGGGLATFFLEPDGKEHGYAFKKYKGVLKFARPGSVYEVETADGKFVSEKFVRTEKSERVEQWIVESEAAEALAESEARAKKAGQEQTIAVMLEPIREIYHKSITPAQRRAVLMSVMEAITR